MKRTKLAKLILRRIPPWVALLFGFCACIETVGASVHQGCAEKSTVRDQTKQTEVADSSGLDRQSGELDWPGVARLRGVSEVKWRLTERTGVVGQYSTFLVLEDAHEFQLARAEDLVKFLDWEEVRDDPEAALDIGLLILGIGQIARVVECAYLYSTPPEAGDVHYPKPFYGCLLVPKELETELREAPPFSDVPELIAQEVSASEKRVIVRIPCIYKDLSGSIRLHKIVITPSSIKSTSERTGIKLENGHPVYDDGIYPER